MKIGEFDNEEKQIVGIIYLPIRGMLNTSCYIMKGLILYNLLLGRPLIYLMESVPSTLHKCIKFEHKDIIYKHTTYKDPYKDCHVVGLETPKLHLILHNVTEKILKEAKKHTHIKDISPGSYQINNFQFSKSLQNFCTLKSHS